MGSTERDSLPSAAAAAPGVLGELSGTRDEEPGDPVGLIDLARRRPASFTRDRNNRGSGVAERSALASRPGLTERHPSGLSGSGSVMARGLFRRVGTFPFPTRVILSALKKYCKKIQDSKSLCCDSFF